MKWEPDPEDLELRTPLIFFLGKPAPSTGVRPIVMASIWGRIWSRHRQPVAGNWELSLNNDSFWGVSGQTCDRAGHVHNIVQRFARLKGFSAASGILDLSKYYEHISHEDLLREALVTGFPVRLLKCLCA
eukprot:3836092-Pyramimonas_sp.AAC.1